MEPINPYAAPQTTTEHSNPKAPRPSLLKLLFSFEGRVTRKIWWAQFVGTWSLFIFAAVLSLEIENEDISTTLIIITGIPLVWIKWAINTKRWHDRGKGGHWIFINLVPLIGRFWSLIECGFLAGDPFTNRYGHESS